MLDWPNYYLILGFQVFLLGYQDNPRIDVRTCGITTHMHVHLLELYPDQKRT